MTERRSRLVPRWAWLFLAGPVIWYVYFWIVYLAAEVGCTAKVATVVTWVTVALTGVVAVAIGYYTWRAAGGRPLENDDEAPGGSLIRAGFLMGVIFMVATAFVGVPALVLQPC